MTSRTAIPTLQRLRDRRDEIAQIGARYGVSNIRVFGSVARGEEAAGSDLDLLVDIERGRSLLDLAGFHLDIQDLLGCDVDLVTDGPHLRSRFRDRVRQEAVSL